MCYILRIHAVTIGLLRDVCYRLVDEHIKDLGLIDVNAHDILEIVDGYVGLGYGKSSKEEQGKKVWMICITCIHTYGVTILYVCV